jgi:hypothetical protein
VRSRKISDIIGVNDGIDPRANIQSLYAALEAAEQNAACEQVPPQGMPGIAGQNLRAGS